MSEKKFAIIASILLCGFGLVMATQHPIPSAFGPFLHPTREQLSAGKTFKSGNRMVGTYYFYWYDAPSKAHVINEGYGTDALTDHPPTLKDFSWKSITWHKKQLRDMEKAGIDVTLMVFWGAPSEHSPDARLYWSFEGLKPLVEAREELVREGHHPPAIGLFYDTSTLQNNSWNEQVDLTTDYGRRWFYSSVRDFFSCIPAKDWAMIDNKPIVLMYASAFAPHYDQSFIDYTKASFARDFSGVVPYLAPQNSWQVKADDVCAWGGALGLKRAGICELGPGYDHSAVPGRTPLVVKRKGGTFYEENWEKFLRRPSNFVMLETWDEFHEGTDICESKEYGRQYIDLTSVYTRLFKEGWKAPKVVGKFTNARSADIRLGQETKSDGLQLIENEDGMTAPVVVQETPAVKLATPKSVFMYFAADDSFKWGNSMHAKLKVEYFDAGKGVLQVEFDGSDPAAPYGGAYTRSEKSVALDGAQQWKTAEFDLPGARFWNSENNGSDFRLYTDDPDLCVRRVTLLRE